MNDKILNIKNKKFLFIGIGIWILMLLRIIKIIVVIKAMKNNNLRYFLVVMCSSLSSMWFLFFLQEIQKYNLVYSLEAIFTVLLMGGFGIYAAYKNNINKNLKINLIYALIVLVIGTIDMSIDIHGLGQSPFSSIALLLSILCELLYIMSGAYLLLFNI